MRLLSSKIKAYKDLFSVDGFNAASTVLADLAKFCRYNRPLYDNKGGLDPYNLAFREGQRSVFLYIMSRTNVSEEEMRKVIENERSSND